MIQDQRGAGKQKLLLMLNVHDAFVLVFWLFVCVCVCVGLFVIVDVFVVVFLHLHCSAQLIMFDLEKCCRNKNLIIIIRTLCARYLTKHLISLDGI